MSTARRAGLVVIGISAGISLAVAFAYFRGASRVPLAADLSPTSLLADGHSRTLLTVQSAPEPIITASTTSKSPHVTITRPKHHDDGNWQAIVTAGVEPGDLQIKIKAGSGTQTVALHLDPYLADRDSDGTPDALHLDSSADRQAFRRWFTFLAEAQFFQDRSRIPAEINDCAALIRYAYREALKAHGPGWAHDSGLPLVLGLEPVKKYQYPYTLLGASLFRVTPGRFEASDLEDGGFAQFADARTLQTFNTYFVSRDLRAAQPGDLLFYRHESAAMPYHTMLYLGASQIRPDGVQYLLYHTGPNPNGAADPGPGEVRRPAVEELLRHPNPEWRPMSGNPTFLGVYRWNILR